MLTINYKLREAFPTMATVVELFSSVDPLVIMKGGAAFEGLATFLTFIGFLLGVSFLMLIKV